MAGDRTAIVAGGEGRNTPAAAHVASLALAGRASVASSLHRAARLATGSEHADGLAYPLAPAPDDDARGAAGRARGPLRRRHRQCQRQRDPGRAPGRLALRRHGPGHARALAGRSQAGAGNAAPGRALSPVEARKLFEAAGGDRNHAAGARDAALLALAYGAGLRRAELAAARLADWTATRSEFTARAAGSGSPTSGRTDAPPPCPPGSRSGGRRTGRSSGP